MSTRAAGSEPPPASAETRRFMGVELFVAPGVLVPRGETELLGRTAAALLAEHAPAGVAVDMCCGSGNLACGVADAVPNVTVWATDLTDSTVSLSRRNVERLGLAGRVFVRQGDLFAGLAGEGLEGKVDLVMCNPPYISTGRLAGDRAHLLVNEPREAFDGGPYGIVIHQRVVREALPFLKPQGWLVFEFGVGQERQVAMLFQRSGAYSEVTFYHDPDSVPRVAAARKKREPAGGQPVT